MEEHYAIKLLRQVEEQKEEIENLKANCKKLDKENQALYESINIEDENMLARLYQEQKEEIKELKENYDKLTKHFIENHISKDKIIAKIEELEEQEDWYIENKSLDDLYGRIDELKELLEE